MVRLGWLLGRFLNYIIFHYYFAVSGTTNKLDCSVRPTLPSHHIMVSSPPWLIYGIPPWFLWTNSVMRHLELEVARHCQYIITQGLLVWSVELSSRTWQAYSHNNNQHWDIKQEGWKFDNHRSELLVYSDFWSVLDDPRSEYTADLGNLRGIILF